MLWRVAQGLRANCQEWNEIDWGKVLLKSCRDLGQPPRNAEAEILPLCMLLPQPKSAWDALKPSQVPLMELN